MTTAEEIENAVERLPPDELARFRAWFEAFEASSSMRRSNAMHIPASSMGSPTRGARRAPGRALA